MLFDDRDRLLQRVVQLHQRRVRLGWIGRADVRHALRVLQIERALHRVARVELVEGDADRRLGVGDLSCASWSMPSSEAAMAVVSLLLKALYSASRSPNTSRPPAAAVKALAPLALTALGVELPMSTTCASSLPLNAPLVEKGLVSVALPPNR